MKKVLALALAAVMIMALCGTALALDVTISINDTTTIGTSTSHRANHVYLVYQVFTGDISDGKLVNVKYGADYPGKTPGDPVPQADLDLITDARAFATSFRALNPSTHITQLDSSNSFTATVATGYYLIVDSVSGSLAAGDALSANIVQVAGSLTINPKKDTTTDTKVISADGLGTTDTHTPDNNKADNVSVGDVVKYTITAPIPAQASLYNYYYFVINDTLDAGLTFQHDIVVKANGITLEKGTDYQVRYINLSDTSIPSGVTYSAATGNTHTFEVGLTDAKAHAGQTITVEYSAKLNENAIIGEDPNNNTSTVTYSNNPNFNYDGTTNPAFPANTTTIPVGETPESKTETYSTGIKIIKVDQNGNPLTGAGFTITGDSVEKVVVLKETFAVDAAGTYYKLNDGTYTTTAPTTATFMQPMGTATASTSAGYVIDNSYTGADKVVVGGVTYRPYARATDVGMQYFVKVDSNAYLYDDPTTLYTKTTVRTVEDKDSSYAVTQNVDALGYVTFAGLGEGTYTIEESTVPTGYNPIDDMDLIITFDDKIDSESSGHWTVTLDGNAVTETSVETVTIGGTTYTYTVYKIEIQNQKGTTLPSTGGIGTTIFYVSGLMMVLGAAVILVARRRADAE